MTTKSIYNYNTVLAHNVHLVRFWSDLIDEIVGQAESNKGKRNDLTSASADSEVEKGLK